MHALIKWGWGGTETLASPHTRWQEKWLVSSLTSMTVFFPLHECFAKTLKTFFWVSWATKMSDHMCNHIAHPNLLGVCFHYFLMPKTCGKKFCHSVNSGNYTGRLINVCTMDALPPLSFSKLKFKQPKNEKTFLLSVRTSCDVACDSQWKQNNRFQFCWNFDQWIWIAIRRTRECNGNELLESGPRARPRKREHRLKNSRFSWGVPTFRERN